jgi:hypothetical protein
MKLKDSLANNEIGLQRTQSVLKLRRISQCGPRPLGGYDGSSVQSFVYSSFALLSLQVITVFDVLQCRRL